jgi:TonB family protein
MSGEIRRVASSATPPRFWVFIAVLALTMAGRAAAQASVGRDIYASGSQRERTPAATVFPEYPAVARRDRLEGEATVCFRVDSEGRIVRPRIRDSAHEIFERPAMRAIRASRFEPLEPGEVESRLEVCRIYRFRLEPIADSDEGAPP